jgi:hypothetical protein
MSGFIFFYRFRILLFGCTCFFFSCSWGDLAQQLAACADAVTQIEFSQGSDTATLTALDGQWVVNHGRAVRPSCLSGWWRVVLNWQLHPLAVDEALQQRITNRIVKEGLHVAVFTKRFDHPLLTFYIVKTAEAGTIIYSGEQLFLANMPYSDYEITDAFSAKPAFWKESTVFSYSPHDLDTLTVEHLQRPEASFQLLRDGNRWRPVALEGNRVAGHENEALINRYVTYFRQVEADTIVSRLSEPALTAIRRHLQHRIGIKSAKGNLTVELFGIPLATGEGYDTDKCLLFMVETEEWAQASWVYFDLLLRDLNDFVDKNKR